ncbi:MAG: hypothetical protein OXH49_00790 [Gemmatimonadetes bacterium]|nr:hypothetical protein [Gemmatimonadota bacterium]
MGFDRNREPLRAGGPREDEVYAGRSVAGAERERVRKGAEPEGLYVGAGSPCAEALMGGADAPVRAGYVGSPGSPDTGPPARS